MSSKLDVLTEEELATYKLNPILEKQIELFLSIHPEIKPKELKVLDWGCGRGRSVAKLRDKGYQVFGVDISQKTIENGFQLFKKRKLSPASILKHMNEVNSFADEYFHVIFSEEVFEHVSDLDGMLKEHSRITKPGGIGFHSFPGSRCINEGHLNMFFVHWLPKNILRKILIAIMYILGKRPPKTAWPDARDKNFWHLIGVLFRYLNNKTFYRDSKKIIEVFNKNGFDAEFTVVKLYKLFFIPEFLKRNGFPGSSILFNVTKR